MNKPVFDPNTRISNYLDAASFRFAGIGNFQPKYNPVTSEEKTGLAGPFIDKLNVLLTQRFAGWDQHCQQKNKLVQNGHSIAG